MQAVDQQVGIVPNPRFIRVMAGFGMIVAAVLIAVAVVSGAIVVAGAVGSHSATTTAVTADTLAFADFRAGERASLPLTATQQAALNGAFRAGERGDPTSISALPQNPDAAREFRAGERGDTGAN